MLELLTSPAVLPPTHTASSPLVHKLHPPAVRQGSVVREALCERMATAPGARLVLVCAPAGFGKTTAMAQCRARLEERGVMTAWLTLDAQDNDLARLLAGLEAAIESIAPELCTTTSGGGRGVGAWALALTERLRAAEGSFALFLDEVEAVQHGAVLSLLGNLIALLPRGGQVVIGTRCQPALPLGRLRASGQLLDVDAEHLRFSRSETAQFFARLAEPLSADAVTRLHERTEGWAAALWLAALALERPTAQSRAHVVAQFSGSHLALADYLAEEVLAGLPTDLRTFLLRTSILNHLEPDLCQALLPSGDAQRQLARLMAANVFVAPVEGEPGTYRYHALFASFLRAQLAREAPMAAAQLHRAASCWYAAQSRPVPAIGHAVEGGDVTEAVRLLSHHAMALLMQGRLQLLARWFTALPAQALNDQPLLQAVRLWAICLTTGPNEAMAQLDGSGIAASPDPAVQAHARALRVALLAMTDRHAEAYAAGQALVAELPSGERFADTITLNVMADTAAVMGHHGEARRLVEAARRDEAAGNNALSRMYSESIDGIIDLVEGRQRQATARFRLAARTVTTRPGLPSNGNAWAGLLQAAAEYEANALEHAERLLHVYVPLACDAGLPDHMILGHVMQSRIAMAQGDSNQAMQRITELEALGHRRQLQRVVASAHLERARIAMHQGDADGAAAELSRAENPALWRRIAAQCHVANDLESLPLSRLRHAIIVGDALAVQPTIAREIAAAGAASRLRRALLLQLLNAMAALRSGDTDAAFAQAELVLQASARAGFVRLVLDEGQLAADLFHQFAARDDHAVRRDPLLEDHLQCLLRGFGRPPRERVEPMQDTLTRGELRVLACMAEGLSNNALAEHLEVSTSTVRTHLRNISSKLGARNRTQAVAIARHIGVLG